MEYTAILISLYYSCINVPNPKSSTMLINIAFVQVDRGYFSIRYFTYSVNSVNAVRFSMIFTKKTEGENKDVSDVPKKKMLKTILKGKTS